ncbi:MAG: hypothetical protein K1Y02_10135 [Candidatus Hydrogenedentes bacterium]|nr:hypothetical protein [Candidatus Hydrogenedentota bacterium]
MDVGSAVVMAVSTAIGLAILEFGSRYVAPAPAQPSKCYEPVPEYVFTLRPGSKGAITLIDNDDRRITVPVSISEQGIRDDRIYGPKSPDEFRIIMLGDSYTMGHGLKTDETYARVLERRLASAGIGKRIVVINMGVGGYAPWQEAGFLQERGFKLEPDLVIWQIFPSNDIAGTYSRLNKLLPTFDVQWERCYYNFRRQNEFPILAERWLQTHSNVYALISTNYNYEGPVMKCLADLRMMPEYKYPRLVPKTDRHWLREPCLVEWYPELTEAFEMMCADIRALKEKCDSRGVDLIGFAHSDEISLFPQAWVVLNEQSHGYQYVMNKDIRVTQECFQSAGIPYAKVTDALLALPEEERLEVFYRQDGHFSPAGAREVGAALADYLVAEYFPRKKH